MIIKSGIEITGKMLNHWEDMGLSESDIALKLGLSRCGLYKIRKRMGCLVRFRSDRGVDRVSPEDRRIRRNEYMRKYYKDHSENRYANMRVGDKVVRRSRHNAFQVIGRVLLDDEVVHHIDGNKSNDTPDNLMVFANQYDHLAFHRGEGVDSVVAEII